MTFATERCELDKSKKKFCKFPKNVLFETNTMSEEIPNLKSSIKFFDINSDAVDQLIDRIPPVTFENVFNVQIQCGPRKITNEIIKEDDYGDSVSIDPIEAILYVSSPKSGDSVKNGCPR